MASSDYAAKSAYRGHIAACYDEHRVGEPLWAVEQAFVRDWVATQPPGATVLDIPAGTGRFLGYFRERGLRVHARDISADMLEEVRRRFAPLPEGFDVRVGDAEHLDLADESVDCVLSWRLLHLLPLPVIDRVLVELRRVCRGPLVIQVFAVRPAGWRRSPWRVVKDALRPLWRSLRPAQPATALPWAHITSYSHAEEDLLAAFARAGLVRLDTRTLAEQDGLANRVYFLTRPPGPAARSGT